MSLMNEYINKKYSAVELQQELQKLIARYNKLQNTYLFVYSAVINKPIPAVSLEQDDFYIIRDLLVNKTDTDKIDIYIETPGGSGEAAEEIIRYLRKNFEIVNFVISGEAKSAGTIIVMAGDEILMTETGSLGPIDAQVRIGRSIISAYDYMEWVENKRKEAEEKQLLNPFDATMIAQITPGELGGVFHALEFAKDIVRDSLAKYKFKNWDITEGRGIPVSNRMREETAQKIACELANHSRWRSHGRSIKINDLEEIGLRVTRIDDDPKLADTVYRIQTVCRLLFESTSIFKIFATGDNKIFRTAVPANAQPLIPKQQASAVEIKQKCPKCSRIHQIYAKFERNPKIDSDYKGKGFASFPKNAKIICNCGFEIDLTGIRNQIESQSGKKILV